MICLLWIAIRKGKITAKFHWKRLLVEDKRNLCHAPEEFQDVRETGLSFVMFLLISLCDTECLCKPFIRPMKRYGVLNKAERLTRSTFLVCLFVCFFCIGGATFLRMVRSISKPSAHYGCPSRKWQKTLLGSETRWRQLNRCCDTVRTDETCAASQASSVR
mgnify:CR=1 FL=1